MTTNRLTCMSLLLLALGSAAGAQPVAVPPDFTVTAVTGTFLLSSAVTSMAVDRFGNAYIMEMPGSPASARVHMIQPDGVVHLDHATGFALAQQLTTNPIDGLVYLADFQQQPSVPLSDIWRIEPSGGATTVASLPVVVDGLTVDDQGRWYVAGVGNEGNGLYQWDGTTATLLASLPQGGGLLQSLVSGDVLITTGQEVQRYEPSTGTLVSFYTPPGGPQPGTTSLVRTMARSPHNQFGAGAILGLHQGGTGGTAQKLAVAVDLLGQQPTLFITESVFGSNLMGTTIFATSTRNRTLWTSTAGSGVPGTPVSTQIFRLDEIPAPGIPGSLFISTAPGEVTLDLHGPAGAPYLLGVMPSPAIERFVPGVGVLALDVLDGAYVPLLDGIGLLRPPSPLAQLPASGHLSLYGTLPPLAIPVAFDAQAIVLAIGEAPNGLAYLSAAVAFLLQ